MSIANTTTSSSSVNPSTLRVRRYRERRREGLCCFTIEMSKDGIEDAIARGMLKPPITTPGMCSTLGMHATCRTRR